MLYVILFLTVLFLPALGVSATIQVPGDYPTIQDAITAAGAGDLVLVAPGTYVENIDFKGKKIAVESGQGAQATVINGSSAGSVVRFVTGETTDSQLRGFTLIQGVDLHGGGIYCQGASPLITENIIKGCQATGDGGGIYLYDSTAEVIFNTVVDNQANVAGGIMCVHNADPCIGHNKIMRNAALDCGGVGCYDQSSPEITGNVISNNTARNAGGAVVSVHDSSPVFTDNLVLGNTALVGGGMVLYSFDNTLGNNIIANNSASHSGGGLYFVNSLADLPGNTLAGNQAKYYGGGIFGSDSKITVDNSILWNNAAPDGPAAWISTDPSVTGLTIRYSDVEGGNASVYLYSGKIQWGPGMIDADPLFVDAAGNDFHLTFPSPCKDMGDNTAVTELSDFEGDPRIAYGAVDMGADEFYPHLYRTGDASPGGGIEIKILGIPGTSPVALCIGSGVLDPPIPSMWGDWYLQFPIIGPVDYGQIPAPEGVLILSGRIPHTLPAPSEIPMQALIGADLTNLCTIAIE